MNLTSKISLASLWAGGNCHEWNSKSTTLLLSLPGISFSLGLFTRVSKKVLKLPRAITHGRICLHRALRRSHTLCTGSDLGSEGHIVGDPSASAPSLLPLYFILKFFAVPACAEGIVSAPCLAVWDRQTAVKVSISLWRTALWLKYQAKYKYDLYFIYIVHTYTHIHLETNFKSGRDWRMEK